MRIVLLLQASERTNTSAEANNISYESSKTKLFADRRTMAWLLLSLWGSGADLH